MNRCEQYYHCKNEVNGVEMDYSIRLNTLDAYISKEIFENEQYHIKTEDIIKFRGLENFAFSDSMTILDFGANIGLASLYFAAQYPQAQIYAFEPEAENYDMLCENTKNFKKITAFHAGVWNTDCNIKLANKDDILTKKGRLNKAAYYFEKSNGAESDVINGYCVNTILEKLNLETVDICKIDIQGAEKRIFSDEAEWLDFIKCLFVEIHDRYTPGCFNAVAKQMIHRDFVYIGASGRNGDVLCFVKRSQPCE